MSIAITRFFSCLVLQWLTRLLWVSFQHHCGNTVKEISARVFFFFFINSKILAVPEFTVGKTHVYDYEAELLGGLPEEGLARAGVKIQSKVLIYARTQNNLLVKVQIFF